MPYFLPKNLLQTRKASKIIKHFITKINPDYIHLDEFSVRQLFLSRLFILKRRKVILNVHDPKPHSGEFHLPRYIYRKLLFRMIDKYVVFSNYSKSILKPQLNDRKKIFVLKLLPYSVYKKFASPSIQANKQDYISFVGRISPYKGVELFVEAIKIVNKVLPKQEFIIAGKPITGYTPDFLNIKSSHLKIYNKFLDNQEMASIVSNSKLIVCPYIDATQSGVIMTSYALNCPVLVTNTGGLPEYVSPKTGIVVKGSTAEAIAEGIIAFLKSYPTADERGVKSSSILKEYSKINKDVVSELYLNRNY